MNIGAFSQQLPQTIANEVITAILDYPGVRASLKAEKDVVTACEANTVDTVYYADVGSDNETVTITTSIPEALTVTSLTHERNDAALSGSSLVAGPVTLTGGQYAMTTTGGNHVYQVNVTDLL